MALNYGAGFFGIRTPEFGISEKLSDLFGGGRNAQGGSNLFGTGSASTTSQGPGQVLGVSQPSPQKYGPTALAPLLSPLPGSNQSPGGGGQSQPTLSNPYQGLDQAAQSGYDAELSAANSALDYERDQLTGQLSSLDRQKANSLSSLQTQLKGVETEVGKQKERSQQGTQDAISQAGSVARTTQSKNRNVLRALGILNSSAAATELTKPINEFDQERARLVRGNLQRLQDLDDFYLQKVDESKNATREIESQYTDLVGRIQNDLRFNDRQRTQAVRDATAALQARKAEIATQMANYQAQIGQLKANFTAQIDEIANYADPAADISRIASMGITGGTGQQSSNAQIYQGDEEKRRLSQYGI